MQIRSQINHVIILITYRAQQALRDADISH